MEKKYSLRVEWEGDDKTVEKRLEEKNSERKKEGECVRTNKGAMALF